MRLFRYNFYESTKIAPLLLLRVRQNNHLVCICKQARNDVNLHVIATKPITVCMCTEQKQIIIKFPSVAAIFHFFWRLEMRLLVFFCLILSNNDCFFCSFFVEMSKITLTEKEEKKTSYLERKQPKPTAATFSTTTTVSHFIYNLSFFCLQHCCCCCLYALWRNKW